VSGPSSDQQNADVIVVGAGHNGLVAACYLARAGLQVLVLESRDQVGGCTTSEILIPEAPEHWFSPCADDVISLRASTVPRDLELARHGYHEIDVDPPYVALAPDGGSLAFWRDVGRTVEEVRQFSPRDARTFENLIEQLMPISDAAVELMATNPTRPDLGSVLRAARVLRHPRGIPTLASLATVSAAQAIQERFEHPIVQSGLAQLANFGSPITLEHTGINLLIVPLIMRVGMARPRGGMGMLPRALERSLVAAGGRVQTSARVDQLMVDAGHIAGVRLTSGVELRAPTVLTATEPTQVLNKWLPAGALSERMAARASHIPTRSADCAHFKIQIALRGRLQLKKHSAARSDGLDLRVPTHVAGTIDDICRAITDAGRGRLPDPLPYASMINTAIDSSLAPQGQDCLSLWSGWVPLEPADGWGDLKAATEKAVVRHAMNYLDGVESLEISRWVESPPDMMKRTSVPNGNVYHVDMTLMHLGPLRPAWGFGGYRTPVPGLYLSGGGTHPGPSVSGLPGQQAARTLLRDLHKGKRRTRDDARRLVERVS
jgi:phytoene dehydrogenase-like protein